MRVWVEALTPKQVVLFSYLQAELPGDVFLTTRDYDLNVELARRLWRKFYVVGRHGGRSLAGKLRQSIERSRRLARIALSEAPDVHVTFVSPDSSRVAFGLGIPTVAATDSPHSDAVNRLALPLSRLVVIPSFIAQELSAYAGLTTLVTFEGVFELARVLRGEGPREHHLEELGLEPLNYAVVRLGEEKAYYYPSRRAAFEAPLQLAVHLLKTTDLSLLVYPRYPDQARAARRALAPWTGRVKFLEKPTDLLSLEFYAALVITGGGTMAVEAALLGTPAVSTYPGRLSVFEYLKSRGFPLYQPPLSRDKLGLLARRGRQPRSWEQVLARLKETFQDPVRVLADAVRAAVGG